MVRIFSRDSSDVDTFLRYLFSFMFKCSFIKIFSMLFKKEMCWDLFGGELITVINIKTHWVVSSRERISFFQHPSNCILPNTIFICGVLKIFLWRSKNSWHTPEGRNPSLMFTFFITGFSPPWCVTFKYTSLPDCRYFYMFRAL